MQLDVQEAEANHRSESSNLTNVTKLHERGTVSEGELRQAKLKVELAAIALERAKVKLEVAQARTNKQPATTNPNQSPPGNLPPPISR